MNKEGLIRTSALISSMFIGVGLASGAAAQEAPEAPAAVEQEAATADGHADIVVTARLRADTLLQVPAAITAVSGQELSKGAVADLTQISGLVPNMIISRGSSGNGGTLSLRGIASTGTNSGIEASISVAVDDISITRGYITQVAFFDLQQVEVLKGPQALFFGKNSPGGVVVVHSADPTSSFSGGVKAGYEFNAGEAYFEGYVGGPITPTLGARIALRYGKMRGWLENTAKPIANPFDPSLPLPGPVGNLRTPDSETFIGRLTLKWEPSNDFTGRFKYLRSRYSDNDSTGYQQVIHCAAGRSHPTTVGVQDPYGDCTADNKRSSGFLPASVVASYPELQDVGHPFTRVDVDLASLKLDYEPGNFSFSSITGYFRLVNAGAGSFDYSVYNALFGLTGETNRTLSQEFRALTKFSGAFNIAAGLYYEDYDRYAYGITRVAPLLGPDPATGWSPSNWPFGDVKSTTKSAFVQLVLNPSESFEITGGVRYTAERKDAIIGNKFVNQWRNPANGSFPGASFREVGNDMTGTFKDDSWSPEATVSWKIDPDQTLYAAYRSGYKSGGFSNTVRVLRVDTISSLQFGSETASGFEAGYKASLLNRRLRLTLDAYRYQYNNLQRSSYDVAAATYIIRNAASATTQGIEADLSFRAAQGLNFKLSGSYNDASYNTFKNAQCYTGQTVATGCNPIPGSTSSVQDLSNTPLPRAPKWVWTAGFDYSVPVASALDLEFAADTKYSGRYLTQEDGDPNGFQNPYWLFNASVRLVGDNGKWDLALIGKNLTNRQVVLSSAGKPGGAPGDIWGFVDRPRQINLQASMKF